MIAAGDTFGGAERQLLTLCAEGKNAFQSVIFPTLAGPLLQHAQEAGLDVRPLLLGKGVLAQGRALAKVLQDEQFNLVHVHGYRGSVLALLAFVFGAERPVVRTVHGAPEVAGKMALYSKLGDYANRLCAGHTVYVSKDLAAHLGRESKKEHVIHNGIRLAKEKGTAPEEYAPYEKNLLVAGRLEPVKNVGAAIEAMANKEVPAHVHLHIVGDGPQREALEARTQELKLSERVSFHGFRPDVLRFIAHADALLLPSLHEGVPYVLLEALSFGTPVIAAKVGGIPEVAAHLVEAYLLTGSYNKAATHADTLGGAIRVVCTNDELRKKLEEQGKLRVQSAFSAESMTNKYAQLYSSLWGRGLKRS